MSRRDKRGRDAGSAQPRLRGCRRFAAAGCLRRPYLFSRKRKDRGEKRAWTRLVRAASEFRLEPIFQASFHTRLTSRVSDYAPPDTREPGLRAVAFEYLQSIEGAGRICWSAPFCIGLLLFCTHPRLSLSRGAGAERLRGYPAAAKKRLPLQGSWQPKAD